MTEERRGQGGDKKYPNLYEVINDVPVILKNKVNFFELVSSKIGGLIKSIIRIQILRNKTSLRQTLIALS